MPPKPDNQTLARLAVSRSRALERAALRVGPGLFLMFMSLRHIIGLDFVPTGSSNRITEYSLAIVLLPIACGGLILVISGLRWLLLALWPARLEIIASAGGLTFCLGPLGTRHYETQRLDLNYLFEISIDQVDEDAIYESLLDPEVQMAEFLPRIRYPSESQRLDRRILYFTRMSEKQAAAALRPFTEHVRRARSHAINQDDD